MTMLPDHTERQCFPYSVGLYLAVNAIRDAYLLVDGPDCAYMKTQYVQGNHDWLSTLTDISGLHRITNSALHPHKMARSREAELDQALTKLADHRQSGLTLISALPMAAITGVDYERIARACASRTQKTVVYVPGRSLAADWLAGYGQTLASLAAHLDLAPGRKQDHQVAIVGYLMDRNEGDHRANLAELERLLSALGLKVCSVWLSGCNARQLTDVAKASVIVSLPYGQQAARVLAKRLGVPCVATSLPVGLAGTSRWLRTIAAATAAEAQAEELIDSELERLTPALQWVVPTVFLHRTISFLGDPYLLEGVLGFAKELGFRLGPSVVTARDSGSSLAEAVGLGSLVFEPTRAELARHLADPVHDQAVDLVVTNSIGASFLASQTPAVELGFPSFFTHALYDRPYLGFSGSLALADRLANALSRINLLRMHSRSDPPPS